MKSIIGKLYHNKLLRYMVASGAVAGATYFGGPPAGQLAAQLLETLCGS